MDIKIIISMFEDLKKLTSEQFSNLSKQLETSSKKQSDQPPQPIIQQVNLSEFGSAIVQINTLIKSGFQRLQEQLHNLSQKLDDQRNAPLTVQKHLYTIELKSSKVIIALVSLSILLLCALGGNIYQAVENSRLSDNDIKYRYIKVYNGINSEQLYELENLFEYNPDHKKQRELRKKVECFEREVRQLQENAEHARLKKEQARQLQKEAKELDVKK